MADVTKIYDKANEAFQRKNYDYAINLFQQVIVLDPNNQKAHLGLYATCMKKQETVTSGSRWGGLLKGVSNTAILASLGALKQPEKVMQEAQKILVTDPGNIKVRGIYGKALFVAGFVDGAIAELETAFKLDRESMDICKALAQCYDAKNDIQKAQELYAMVLKRTPEDRDAHRALRDLAARGTIQDGGLETATSSRDIAKDKTKIQETEQAAKLVKTDAELDDEIVKIRAIIAADPAHPQMAKHWKKIGEVLRRMKDLPGAIAAYEEALKLDTMDATIRFNIGDLKMKGMEEERSKAQAAGNADLARKLNQELVAYKIAEYAHRVKDHPTDMALKYEYGVSLYAGRQFKEALGQFQQTVKDPKRKLNSLMYQGLAFHHMKSFDIAISNFHKALEENPVPGNDFDKTVRYSLATTLEAKGDKAAACSEYERIMELDISFKDVANKVEALKADTGS